ncbi:hypothetical protein Dimus_002746 [Dionaea muscipula]
MGRSPCCAKEGLNRGAWTAIEDQILTDYINTHGDGDWRYLPKRAGLKRCGKSCRLRWLNYLRPDIKRGNITRDEEDLIIRLHKLLGNRWSLIAGRLPGRTDNEIKNHWNTNLSKKIHHHQEEEEEEELHHYHRRKATRTSWRKLQQLPPFASKAVRTKAVRCTRVFLPPSPNHHHQQQPPDSNTTTAADTGAGLIPPPDHPPPGVDDLIFARLAGDIDHQPPENHNLTVDFGSGPVPDGGVFSHLLQDLHGPIQYSEFSDIDNVELGIHEETVSKVGTVSPSPEQQTTVFSDEMFDDWTGIANAAYHQALDVDYWLFPQPFI